MGSSFEVTWGPKKTGTVQVRIARDEQVPSPGAVIPIDDFDRIGPCVPAAGPTTARGEFKEQRVFQLVPITVNGSSGTVGRPTWVCWIDDVHDLLLDFHGESFLARWKWPDKSRSAWLLLEQIDFRQLRTNPARRANGSCGIAMKRLVDSGTRSRKRTKDSTSLFSRRSTTANDGITRGSLRGEFSVGKHGS